MTSIALAGPFGVGKTTVAEYLEQVHGMSLWSFGDYVRQALMDDEDMTFEEAYAEPKPPDLRLALQNMGHGRRQDTPDVWVDALLHDFTHAGEPDIVVDDMRYANEAEHLFERGFRLVQVQCPDLYDDPARGHASEHGLDGWSEWDGVITAATGDLGALYEQVDAMVERWEHD